MVSFPESLLQSLASIEGFDKVSFVEAHRQSPPVSVRFNTNKVSDEIISTIHLPLEQQIPWCEKGYYLSERPKFTLDPALHAGAYYVQEPSSMFLHYLLSTIQSNESGLKALDLCAAPGGKSTILASLPQFDMVISNELIKTRVSILFENVVKWGAPHVFVTNNDPSAFTSLNGYFDTIVVDAPCSGSGLFRKDPKAIDEWSENNVKLCAERQKRILADVLPALKEGGLLVYATCSYSVEENEGIMDWLMQHAALEPIAVENPEVWGITLAHGKLGGIGYRFFPGKTKGEGFFIACFRMVQQQHQPVWFPEKKLELASANEIQLLKDWVTNEPVTILKKNDQLLLLPQTLAIEVQLLQNFLYFRKSGVMAGTVIRDQFIPEHELVLSLYCRSDLPVFEVDEAEALQYLRKQVIDTKDDVKGWYIVQYKNLRLGLIKHLGNRINNYYPASWRILKS